EVTGAEFIAFLGKGTNKDLSLFTGAFGGLPPTPNSGGVTKTRYAVNSFAEKPEHTLIVYGTRGDAAATREAAEELQRLIRVAWSNFTVPMESDEHVTEDDLKTNHVILVGRPATNAVADKYAKAFPVEFGPGSFVLNGDLFSHPESAVLAA